MPRILYIDVPFENATGGDKNRSRFLWSVLRRSFEADLLLCHPHPGPGPSPDPSDALSRPALELQAGPARFPDSNSVPSFPPDALARFNGLLTHRRYDAVLTRFHTHWHLARQAHRHPSRPAVAVDLDMLSSRLVGLAWAQNRSVGNRWFLFEHLKLLRLDRSLVQQPWLVFFSNPVELELVRRQTPPARLAARLAVLPNILPDPPPVPLHHAREPVILFFGSLNSAANTDAFQFLVTELLPLIDASLRQHQVHIHVAGRHPPAWFQELLNASGSDRVRLIGGVDSMEEAIAASRFVLLPLRIASGTRTRILEAAAQHRAVITTSLGAEGIDTGDDAILADNPGDLAIAIRQLLEQPDLAARMGDRLHHRCRERYAASRVAAELVHDLSDHIARRPGTAP